MRRGRARLQFAVAATLLATSGCAAIQPAGRSAVEYNRAFANARDEIVLLNVLRASEQQPLQFSTISAVQGGVRNNASLRIPFTNLIAGGDNVISPEVTISSRNPSVSIVPLATREFVQGISRPLEPQVIGDLLSQGWSKDVVLALAIGGVVCANETGTVVLNTGEDGAATGRFLNLLLAPNDFSLTEPKSIAQLRMSSRDAMAFIKDGAGPGNRIKSVTPIAGRPEAPQEAIVEVISPGTVGISGLDFDEMCGKATPNARNKYAKAAGFAQAGQHGVLMRSVLGIFRYLGRAQSHNFRLQLARCGHAPSASARESLFNIRIACARGDVPPRAVVDTEFQGRRYFIPAAASGETRDRTLETLSLLTYLVDLQTSESSLRGSTPFVAITQ